MTAPRDTTPRVHRTAVQMRFADTDALGHVNNGSFVLYAETARLEFLGALGGAVQSLILAHLAIDFRRQVTFGQTVVVDTWVERIGQTSVTILHAIRADDAVAAEVRSVVVSFDYAAQRPRPWTDAQRAALDAYRAIGG
ncbi:acyl-CoA thioesterase [Roseisolibacter agri]|uniref:Thioesterase n=1 Tax=Roseisolibacter agri TaxID=2014610 RepID=A0AA37Q408_9BACT|nr:thioesterase family protein [Roseisolibacter agri]GLC24217.1 thioesterase [Roseisolibacter agri]